MVIDTISTRRAFTTGALIAALVAASAVSAFAGPHRARLSREVAERLDRRIETPGEFIVATRADRIDAVAARYGATVKKRITGGVVLEATGGQLDALSQDPEVDHIASNAKVFRMMAVTTQ